MDLIASYGLSVVQAYMKYIQENAEVAVREMLKKIAYEKIDLFSQKVKLQGEDVMDDGSKIQLQVDISLRDVN